MCEAKAELDEEEVKYDISMETLPEPLLIILSPPPPFLPVPGEPTMLWTKWLKAFEHYIHALGEKELADSSKLELLQNCIGLEGERIFTDIIKHETTYANAVSALTNLFSSDHTSQECLFKFYQRAQMPGETIDEFVSALEELLRPCNFDHLKNKLLLDQLIDKTNYPQFRERLLQKRNTLTLATALTIGKEMESLLNESQQSGIHEVSVDIGYDLDPPVTKKAKRGRPRRGEQRAKTKPCVLQKKSSQLKNEYHCINDKQYNSDEDEDKSQGTDAPNIASDKAGDDDNITSPSLKVEEKDVNTTSGSTDDSSDDIDNDDDDDYEYDCDDDDDDEDFVLSPAKHKCPICSNRRFKLVHQLTKHMKTHTQRMSAQTQGQKADRTKVKKEANANWSDADSHLKGSEVHDLMEDENSEPDSQIEGGRENEDKLSKSGHFCPICVDRRFKGANKLARHMRTHTKEKPFKCPVCMMTFSQSYHMTRHLRNQHTLGEYICIKCGEGFKTWLDLKDHKKTHAIEGVTCLACDKQFDEKAALVKHLKTHKKVDSRRQNFTCNDCGKEFRRMYHLKRHIMTHRKGENAECYQCLDCQKTFAFPEDLNKHLEDHVKENSGTCPKCNETFGSPEEVAAHMVVHQKSYSCSLCGKKFKVEYALKKHEQNHESGQYYCSLCQKYFHKHSHYKRHKLVHSRRETKCPHCDRVFLRLTSFKYHLRTHVKERPYQCSCCVESFEKEEDLEQHCLKHRKFKRQRPYSCSRCDNAFSTLEELTNHMSSHEGEQPQTCPVCGRTFLNKNKLERHLTIHTGERPHLCSICGNGFPSAASLKLHVHIHTGEKPYKCEQCNKTFSSSSGLRLHNRKHTGERPSYGCHECGRTYGRMTELKMHQRYHTGDKPYECTCCSKRFISKDKLNVHMRTHTGERPYSCPHCGQTFTQTGDRNRHISKYHS